MSRSSLDALMVRAALAVASLVAAGGLTSCGLFLVSSSSEDQWEELFEFEMRPGTKNPAEAEQALLDRTPTGRIVPGSVVHRGSVEAPGGVVNFYSYRVVDPEVGPEPAFCESTVAGSWMGVACGDGGSEEMRLPIQMSGESSAGAWRSAEFLTQDDVVRVEATAADGTVYTITPANGFGYVEWPDERGSLELVAYDAGGQELDRVFTGRGF